MFLKIFPLLIRRYCILSAIKEVFIFYYWGVFIATTRGIGIRKVLGASVVRITTLLSKDFLVLVMISFTIASPIAWLLMNKWLQTFPYHVNLNWWIFMLTGLFSLIIALITVSYQAIKAAIVKPAQNLRAE